jgi:hypothetical protein
MLHPDERAALKSALLACDKKTQIFIQPVLGVPAVQHLLVTFMKDPAMSFEEWLWEPKAHRQA